jgi:hypothetical protein
MRLSMLGFLVVCVGGFLATSGIVTFRGAGMTPAIETAALEQSLPVLLAFAAPALLLWLVVACRQMAARTGWMLVIALGTFATALACAVYAKPELALLLARA